MSSVAGNVRRIMPSITPNDGTINLSCHQAKNFQPDFRYFPERWQLGWINWIGLVTVILADDVIFQAGDAVLFRFDRGFDQVAHRNDAD